MTLKKYFKELINIMTEQNNEKNNNKAACNL